MNRSALFYFSLILFPALFALSYAQEPKPQDPNDKRGLGIQSASPTPATATTTPRKTAGVKPEIVLQAGITSPQTQLAFSPDGKLLASMGMLGNSIKLWEVPSGRLLRQLESSIPTIGSSSMSRPFRFSEDGRTIIAVADGRVRRWSVETGQELSNTILPNCKDLTIAIMSDDASTLAALNMDSSGVRLWDLNTGNELRTITFDESENLVTQDGVVLSPDGKQLAAMTVRYESKLKGFKGTMNKKEQVTIWDVTSGKKAQTITVSSTAAQVGMGQVNNLPIDTMQFTPDGQWFALRTRDKVKVWEAATGKELKEFNTPSNAMADPAVSTISNHFIFSSDKQTLAMISNVDSVSLVDLASTNLSHTLKGHQASVVGISFSRDGKLLASSGMDNKIKMWDVTTGNELSDFSGAAMPITDIAFSPDGKSLALAGQKAVTYWELSTGGVRRSVSLKEDYSSTAQFGMVDHSNVLSPDARLMLAGSHTDPSVKLWNVTSGKESATVSLAAGKILGNAAFNSDGRLFAVLENNRRVRTPDDSASAANTPQATPTPSPTTGPTPRGMPPGMPQGMPAGMQMPDMSKLMERMKKDPKGVQAEMKKAQEAMEKGDISAGMEAMESLGITPGGARKSSNPSSLRIVESATGREIRSIPLPGGYLNDMMANLSSSSSAVSFSPDGHYLASASGYNAPIQILDTDNGQVLQQLKTPYSLGVNSLTWSPDGKVLASTQWTAKDAFTDTAKSFSFEDMAFSIKLWDPKTGTELKTLVGHKNFIMKLAFSADGRTLASGSLDSTIKIWDVQSGAELRTLRGHSGAITAIDFSSDGKFMVSGSDDGSARLWNAQSGELLATMASLNGGNDWLVVTPSGLFDGSPRGWDQILWRFSPAISDVSPVESFFSEYFHPGLLTDIIEGKQLAVAEDISQKDRRQPKLTLKADDAVNNQVSSRTTKLTINIADAPAGAQDVRLFRNGSLVKLWRGDVLKGQQATSIDANVTVVAGPNEFRAYAFNHDNVKSTDALLTLQGANSLQRKGTLHLLVTGVNEYANPEYNLKYAAADAKSFAEEVETQQRKLNQYQQIQVTTLLDQNATKANFLYALNRLSGAQNVVKPAGAPAELDSITPAQPEDAVILYFAGHGTAQQQRFYLIPHDIGYTGKRTELNRAGLESILSHGISDLELEEAFVGNDAGVMLMVIDACNSGQALEAEEKRRGPMNSKGLAQLAYEKGMYILTAAQSYQAALEASQLGHGYLTYALVEEGLKTPAADKEPKDGEVQLREWLDYATERVPEMQEQKMHEARGLKLEIAFVEGEEKVADVDKRKVQRPRVFYRREQEAQPLIVAKE